MTAHIRFLIAAAIGALIAPLAMVALTAAPAGALGTHKHEVYLYKVERSLRLAGVGTDTVGDSSSQTLSCNPGDHVLDGMWSIKNVDQYNPPPYDPDDPPGPPPGGVYNDERDVYVVASFPDMGVGFESDWYFEFDNRAFGDAQVKIFVTCIRGYTEFTNSHRHQIHVIPAVGLSVQATTPHAWADRWQWESTNACPSGYLFVAPGFNLAGASADDRPVASVPSLNGRDWHWEFGSTSSTNVTFYGKCIERKVLTGNGHRHVINMQHLPNADFNLGHLSNIPAGDPKEVQYSCDQDHGDLSGFKAAVGWFWMGDWWEYNWFLGMEPRPKTRSFVFWNGAPSSAKVRYGALCINSRTSNPTV